MAGGGRGCFKTGCIGCLVVAGLGLVAAIVVALLLAFGHRREPQPQDVDLVQELPPRPVRADEIAPGELELGARGRVLLDLSLGEFRVEAGPPGQPIRVESHHDPESIELEQAYESDGASGWTYRLRFARRGLRGFTRTRNSAGRLRLILPRETPLALEGSIGMGRSELELGGLWLTGVDLRLGMGEHTLSFDEPQPFAMEYLRLQSRMGALRIDELGNASPAEVDVRHSLGELELDLRGAWRGDGRVEASCSMGAFRARVPRDVALVIERSTVRFGEAHVLSEQDRPAPPAGAPTLTLALEASFGELRVDE